MGLRISGFSGTASELTGMLKGARVREADIRTEAMTEENPLFFFLSFECEDGSKITLDLNPMLLLAWDKNGRPIHRKC